MNWNDNDTKYIIKRIILYILIMGIVFFAGQRCAKAATSTANFQYTQLQFTGTSEYNGTPLLNGPQFSGMGQGYAVFTMLSTGEHPQLREVYINVGTSSSSVPLVCEIGTVSSFTDSSTESIVYTAKCPGNLTSSGIYSIGVRRALIIANDTITIRLSDHITFVTNESDANAINNAAATASQNEINNIIQQGEYDRQNADANATRIINEINSATSASTTAINNNTQAINDLNDNIMQDYNGPSQELTDSIFSFDSLFSSEDSDVIRGILLFPLRLFAIILSAIDRSTCVTYSFGTLFGYELRLPCITYSDYLGSIIYSFIDWTFALAITFGLIRYIISLYDFVFSVGLKGAAVVAAVEVFK